MLSVWVTLAVASAYLVLLFTIAYRGDRQAPNQVKPYRYALAQGVHCTTWAFYGTITQSAFYGWSFAPTYVGAIVVFLFAHRLQLKLLHVCKTQNITSIADLISHRFGGAPVLAGLVALITLVAVVPYIALQLRAVTASFAAVTGIQVQPEYWFGDIAALVAIAMIGFAILFGTRRLSLAEQHSGLMDAVAFESVVKLVSFAAIGIFCTYILFDGLGDLMLRAAQDTAAQAVLRGQPEGVFVYLTHVLLGALSMFCLPRQFHVGYIENTHPDELRTARWAFPLYLFAINFFILPIALAGTLIVPDARGSDTFMLAIFAAVERPDMALVAFIGGLSAATSMVIIATLALSIMMSNDVFMPLWIRLTRQRLKQLQFNSKHILTVRRVTVLLIISLAYAYHVATQATMPLVNSGLIALALLAQLTPAMLLTLVWRRANKFGASLGLIIGTALWFSLLLLPSLQTTRGLSDIEISHGLLISLGMNLGCFMLGSWWYSWWRPAPTMTLAELPNEAGTPAEIALTWGRLRGTLAQFFDQGETEKLARRLQLDLNAAPADALVPAPIIERVERELATVIGSAASRLTLQTVVQQPGVPISQVVSWATQASEVYKFNRELLQASVENIPQGISVVDQDLRLVAWNRRYLEVFQYPDGFLQAGMPVAELLRYNAERGLFGQSAANLDDEVDKRLNYLRQGSSYRYQREQGERIIELQGSPMPGGGFVTTYTDITDLVRSQQALQQVNLELEQRVADRTQQLLLAKQAEEQAHQSKTKFFAAVSHDLMQPFNAATLFCEMLQQRLHGDQRQLAQQLHHSLQHAEELITMLLEMTRLEAGNLQPVWQTFSLQALLTPLIDSHRALAQRKGIRLAQVPTSALVHSDRKLLTRIIQNLLANAVRYTDDGKVLVGCRLRGLNTQQPRIVLCVMDTGVGIPSDKQADIFREFHQLQTQADNPGLGLGLAIVERMCRLLHIPLTLRSLEGRGTSFMIELPFRGRQRVSSPSRDEVVATETFLRQTRMLVVDNDPAVLSAMSQLLESWGAQVCAAANLNEVQAQLMHSEAPQLALVDYHLDHHRTGIEIVQWLQQHFAERAPAIILNSADSDEDIREAAIQVGAAFIPKPVKPGALKRLLKRALQQQLSDKS